MVNKLLSNLLIGKSGDYKSLPSHKVKNYFPKGGTGKLVTLVGTPWISEIFVDENDKENKRPIIDGFIRTTDPYLSHTGHLLKFTVDDIEKPKENILRYLSDRAEKSVFHGVLMEEGWLHLYAADFPMIDSTMDPWFRKADELIYRQHEGNVLLGGSNQPLKIIEENDKYSLSKL